MVSGMKVKYYKNATDFLTHVGSYLAKDEARYGLILGIAKAVEVMPHRYGQEKPWFCSIGRGNTVNAVAIRTPPHMVIVSYFFGDIEVLVETLLTAVSKDFKNIPGVIGDKELVDPFTKRWCEKFGVTIQSTMAQRIYRLDKVNDVPKAPGKFRAATMADKELVVKWFHAFHIDIGAEARGEPLNDVTPAVEQGRVFLWEDGKPVSMALKTRPTEKGMSVGGVYTPPELRGKGYATSCVAELSRNILQSGKEFCTLYTDLANPTSNSIYIKIGYRPVCDSVQCAFGPHKNA
jgi:predicted GNAT family acetyltransferase